MAEAPEVVWTGISGKKYTYWLYKIGTTFNATPGNYIFCKQTEKTLTAVYIGQTGDLSERFDYHHKMPCIKRNEATHICVHKSSKDEDVRKTEENDLIVNYNPICNRP